MWVEIALAASVLQTTRNALARSLSDQISPALNSWSRFAFNLPFALALVGGLAVLAPLPELSWVFFGFCLATGLSQLLGNVALVTAFRYANFAESITLHKLEVVFAALVGAFFFAEEPSALGWLGIVLCTAGVLLMNLGRQQGPEGWRRAFHLDRGAILAMLCALLLVMASFMLKEATSVFALLNPRVGSGRFEAAAYTLFHTTWMGSAHPQCLSVDPEPKGISRSPSPLAKNESHRSLGFCRESVLVLGLLAHVGRLREGGGPTGVGLGCRAGSCGVA